MRNTGINESSIAEAGLDPQKVTDLLDRVKKEVDEGLLPSAQIALARNGKLGVFETFGKFRRFYRSNVRKLRGHTIIG